MTDKTMTLEQAVGRYRLATEGHGCSDGNCLVKRPEGMHTNGGCRCSRDYMKSQRVMYAAQIMADAITRHLSQTAERGETVAWGVANKNGVLWKFDAGGAALLKESADHFVEWANSDERESYYADNQPFRVIDLYTAPPPAAGVPEKRTERLGGVDWGWEGERNVGWNECVDAMLSATPSPAINIAAVREVIENLRNASALLEGECNDLAHDLIRAIGDKP